MGIGIRISIYLFKQTLKFKFYDRQKKQRIFRFKLFGTDVKSDKVF